MGVRDQNQIGLRRFERLVTRRVEPYGLAGHLYVEAPVMNGMNRDRPRARVDRVRAAAGARSVACRRRRRRRRDGIRSLGLGFTAMTGAREPHPEREEESYVTL